MSRHPYVVRLIVVAAAAVLAASDALAAGGTRISIAGIRKDDGKVTKQLNGALCGTFECVPGARVKRGGSVNFAAARAAGVSGVLFGTVATVKGKKRLEIALLVSSLKPKRRWVFPLQGGRVARRDLDQLSSELEDVLGGGGGSRAAPPPQAYTPPVPPPAPAPAIPPPAAAPADEPLPPESTEAEALQPVDTKATASAEPEPYTPSSSRTSTPSRTTLPEEAPEGRWAAVDVGMDLTQRKLSYSGVRPATGTLQTFSVGSIVSPTIRVEVSPWGSNPERTLAGLTFLFAYSRSVGLTAEAADAPGVKHESALQRVEVGAGWRLRPFSGSGFAVTPRVGWRSLALVVGAKNGTKIAGLPDANLSGVSLGLDLELPFARRFALLGGIGYTAWTQAKQLVGTGGFFPSGSAWALDASAGLSVGVRGPFSVRVLGDFSSTTYTFKGTSIYTASGATDRYVGGRVLARMVF